MTEQPTPPPEDPNAWQPPPSYSSSPTPSAPTPLASFHQFDLGLIGAGLLTFIASLLPFYTASADVLGSTVSDSGNAWNGFFGWFGALCALAGAVLVGLHAMKVALPIPVRLAALVAFGLAALCMVLAFFIIPGSDCDDVGLGICDAIDFGHGFGYWLALILSLAGAALAFLRLNAED